MDSAIPNNCEKAIFEQALDVESREERLAFVKNACGGDTALLARVNALLRAHETAEEFLPEAPKLQATVVLPITEKPGDKIGRYRLMEKSGEGGCGVVYVAEQEEPVHRKVALKVIKLGMDTQEVVARFEAERQALALMDHPNIARVFDGGATDTGRPYFVLELVRGVRITEFCDQHQLPTVERLKLFIEVCHAIQHAHQKGIIHRDIKPSNILVSLHDDVPVPKVIDFGIAKAVGERLTDKTLYTRYEQFMGTPAYMSPEQAGHSDLDIDTRSDIYALGVLLYELLAGRPPFDPKHLAEAGLEEMVRCIREQEPLRPSTRLSRLQREELTTTAQQRGTEPPRLISLLRGDLDWIVMKCLEKNRTRRYDTANGLAHDIESYLNHEPISARPPSTAYRVGKFLRRNKVMVSAAGAVGLALVLGIIGSTWQAVRATRAEGKAEKALENEAAQRQQAEKAQANETQLRKQAQAQAYASDMKAAQVALQQDNRAMAVDLLRRYLPKPNQEDLRGLEWRYLWQESRSDEVRSFPHPSMVRGASLTSDGRYLATAGHDGKTRVWETASARLLQEFDAQQGPFEHITRSVGFSPDGKWLAFAGKEGVEIRDTASWNLVHELKSTMGPLAFSPGSNWLVTTGTNGLELWDLGNWNHRTLTNATAYYNNLAFTPDGLGLVCPNRGDARMRWCNLLTGTTTVTPGDVHPLSLGISPDGNWLASGHFGGEVWNWDCATRQVVTRFQAHRGLVYGLAFSPDGKLLATGGNDQLIHLWETGTTNKLTTLQGHLDEIWSLDFSRDGQTLVSASKDGTAKLWSVRPGPTKSRSFALRNNSWPMSLLPDGTGLFTLDRDQLLTRLWNLPDSPLTLDRDQLVTRLWSLPDGRLIRSNTWSQLEEHGCSQWIFLPSNQRVVGVSSNGTVHFWNLTTGSHLNSISLGGSSFWPLNVSRDNRWLLGSRVAGGCTLYDLRTARPTHDFPDLRVDYDFAAFSPDGRWLAGGTTNCDIRIWDLVASRERTVLKGHKWFVFALRFSPDGKLLASGGWDSHVWLWSLETGKPLYPPLKGHQSGVTPIVFSSDGKTLVTGSDDGTIRWWSVAAGKEMLLFQNAWIVSRNRMSRSQAEINPGGNVVVWQEPQGLIRVTTLPTLAEIDAAEAQRMIAGPPKALARP